MLELLKKLNEMRRDFFASPSRAYPFWFFVFLFIAIGYYFGQVVPAEKSRILERDFSILASASDQFRNLVQSHSDILEAEIDREQRRKDTDDEKDRGLLSIPAYLNMRAQSVDLFVSCPEDSIGQAQDQNPNASTKRSDQNQNHSAASGKPDRSHDLGALSNTTRLMRLATLGSEESSLVAESHFSVNRGVRERILCIQTSTATIIDRVFANNRERFEGLALALSTGSIVYQHSQNDFRLTDIGTLLEKAYDPTRQGKAPLPWTTSPDKTTTPPHVGSESLSGSANWRDVGYTTLIDAELGDKQYKLLVQPVPLPLELKGSSRQYEHATLSLVGVVSSERLESEARHLPPPTVSSIVGVLALAMLMFWPLLKLRKMSPSDGLSRLELWLLAGTLLLATSLSCLLVIDFLANNEQGVLDERLDWLADQVNANLVVELNRILNLLEGAPSCISAVDSKAKNMVPYARLFDSPEDNCKAKLAIATYPWLDQIAWMNDQGDQIVKWAAGKQTTRPTNMSRLEGFVDVQNKELWTLRSLSGVQRQFILAPIDSPNTGSYLPLVWEPSSDKGLNTVVLSSFLLSLINPTLPPDFGFEVVDDQGEIQFQSEGSKLPRESIFKRVSSEDLLRDAIRRTEIKTFTTGYLDGSVRMHARPLGYIVRKPLLKGQEVLLDNKEREPQLYIVGHNWTLITWYRLESRKRLITDVMSLSLACLPVYYMYLIIVALIFYRVRASIRPLRLLWKAGSAPWIPVCILILLIIAFGAMFNPTSATTNSFPYLSVGTWIVILVFPIVVGVVLVLSLYSKTWACGPGESAWNIQQLTCAMLIIYLATVILGAFPPICFTRLCWDQVRPVYAQNDALKLRTSLLDRDMSIRTRSSTVPASGTFSDALSKRCDVQLDRYDLHLYAETVLPSDAESRSWLAGRDPVIYYFVRLLKSVLSTSRLGEAYDTEVHWDFYGFRKKDQRGDWLGLYYRSEPKPPFFVELPLFPITSLTTIPVLLSLAIGFLLLALIIYFSLYYRFLWRYKYPAPCPAFASGRPARNTIIVRSPWTELNVPWITDPDVRSVTLSEILNENLSTWQAEFGPPRIIVINSFEAGLKSGPIGSKTKELLSFLLALPNKVIVLVTIIDPLYWIANTNDDLSGDYRKLGSMECCSWLNRMTAFQITRATSYMDAKWVEDQCYWLWNSCSRREKLVLWHTATQGVPNPKNKLAIDNLARRGLLAFDAPAFSVPEKSLCAFLRSPMVTSEVKLLFPREVANSWQGARLVLILSSAVILLIVFLSYAEFWGSSALQFLTIGATVAIPIFKLIAKAFTGGEKGEKLAV